MSFRLSPQAEADIKTIALRIESDNPAAAHRWLDGIHRRIRLLGDMPEMGVAKPEVRPELRMFAAGNYLILYAKVEGGVDIVRVVHGARKWQDII